MKRFLFPGLSLSIFFVATTAFAADTFTFQPIIPTGALPLPTDSLCNYLNAIFKLSIAVSVVLAVIMIIIDGFKYMTSEAVGNKKDALGGIRSALGGLILLLASYLLLFIINPQILSFSVASTNGGVLSGVCGTNAAQQGSTGTGNQQTTGSSASFPQSDTSLSTSQAKDGSSSEATWCYAEGQGSFCFPGTDSQSVCEKAAPEGVACTQQTSP